jgi:hypothetical protein
MKRKVSLRQSYAKRLRERGQQPFKRRKGLSRVSRTRRLQHEIYVKKRNDFLFRNPICEFDGCFARATDLHHVRGRAGKNYLDERTWKALCVEHHKWVHAHPREARAKGLLASAVEFNTSRVPETKAA